MTRQRSTTRSRRTVGVLMAMALSALLAGFFAPAVMAEGAEGTEGELPELYGVDAGTAVPAGTDAVPTTVATPAPEAAVASAPEVAAAPAPEATAVAALDSQAGETVLDTPAGPLAPAAVTATDTYKFLFALSAAKADTYADGPSRPYSHSEGGGTYGTGPFDPESGATNELLARDFSCEDVVSYFLVVTTDGNAPEGEGGIVEADVQFDAASATGPGAAFTEVLGVTALNDDPGAVGSKDSTATIKSQSVEGEAFTPGAKLVATIEVTNVERNDVAIVRVDVRLSCNPGALRSGALLANVTGGRETAPNSQELNGSPGPVQMIQLSDLRTPFSLEVTADPLTVVRDRTVVTYTVSFNSVDAEPRRIQWLTDSILGDVTQVQGGVLSTDCNGDNLIAPQLESAPGTCTYTAKSLGEPGTDEVHTVEASDSEIPDDPEAGYAHDSVTIHIADPGVAIDKEFDSIVNDADGSGTVTAGDTIGFVITVTNTGDIPLTGVHVVELLAGASDPECSVEDGGTVAVGGQTVCTATYTITAADAVAGGVENSVQVTTNETGAQTGAVSVSVSPSPGGAPPTLAPNVFVPLSDEPPPASPIRPATVIDSQLPFTGTDTVRVVSFAVAVLAAGAAAIVWGAGARRPVRPLGS